MDIGIYMSRETLVHKLSARRDRNPEQAWNLSRWPTKLSEEGDHRLFVATQGKWVGYFKLSKDALYNPNDTTPYTLLFDTRTWTRIPPTPVKPFRGFTYNVPNESSAQTNQ